MECFEYEITKHPADEFQNLVYFCTVQGECELNQMPLDQLATLRDLLNKKGGEGWELVQLFFGSDGVVVFWKRAK